MLTRIFAVVLMLCAVSSGFCQAPRKIAEMYETQVFGLSPADAEGVGELLPAVLIVRPAELNGGVTSVTMELVSPTTAALLKLTKSALPVELEDVLGDQDEVILNPTAAPGQSYPGMQGHRVSFDVGAVAKASGASATSYDVTVVDPFNQPAAGIVLKIAAGSEQKSISLGTITVPADGRVRLRMPRATQPKDPAMANHYVYDPYASLRITATDPLGQRQILDFPQPSGDIGSEADYEKLYLALAPQETTAPVYRGRVIGPDGEPVNNVTLSPNWLETPGRGGTQMHYGPQIMPAPDGRFAISLPHNLLMTKLGVADLPASATISVRTARSVSQVLRTDRENVITLPYVENVQIQLLDAQGAPLKGLKQYYIRADIRQFKDENDERGHGIQSHPELTDPENAILNIKDLPLPGLYAITINDLPFERVMLEKGAGGQLVPVRQRSDQTVVQGRVVEAETGKPLEGAWVVSANDGNAGRVLSSQTNEALEEALAAWEQDSSEGADRKDQVKFANGTLFQLDNVARTDADGRFTLTYTAGAQPKSIHVYTPGRMAASATGLSDRQPEAGTDKLALPEVGLPRSSLVTVPIVAPDHIPDKFLSKEKADDITLRSAYSAYVGFDRGKPWHASLPALNASKENPWKLNTGSGWAQGGSRITMAVPADTKFTVTVAAPNHETIGNAHWADLGPLAPGASLTLPDKQVSINTPFLVVVKNKDGSPAAGVSVRIDGRLPLTTDAEGTVIGWSSGHVGRVEAMTENDWKVAASKHDITVNSGEAMTQVELVLP